MATRRMFSKEIIQSDAFLELPPSSQCLYIQLCMEADDSGYVNKPNSVVKLVGATQEDLEILTSSRFILRRSKGIVLIKHWLINNSIQTENLTKTNYLEDYKSVFLDINKAYTLTDTGIKPYEKTDLKNSVFSSPKNTLNERGEEKKGGEYKGRLKELRGKEKKDKTVDKTKIKANCICEELAMPLVKCGYIENFADLFEYGEIIKELKTKYNKSLKDLKIKIKYFLNCICDLVEVGRNEEDEPILEKKISEHSKNTIQNRLLYFKSSLENELRRDIEGRYDEDDEGEILVF